MAIIKAVSSRASLGNAVNYITKKEKTEEKLVSGLNCSPKTAIDEMKITKVMYNKTNKRQYYHFVQSFSPDEKITLEEAHKMAKELAEKRFKGYEVVVATHKDTEHIHSHFIVNSVNLETGYKLNWSKGELQKMKDMSDDICRAYDKSICQKGQGLSSYNLNKYKSLEKAITGNYKSYVLECYKAVMEVKDISSSREEFIKLMADKGYQTNWKDTRKNITFIDKDGHKIRNSKLEKDFKEPLSKGDLENGFKINAEQSNIREKAREVLADTGRRRTVDPGTNRADREEGQGTGADAFEGVGAFLNLIRDEDRDSKEELRDKILQRKDRDNLRIRQENRESRETRRRTQDYDLER